MKGQIFESRNNMGYTIDEDEFIPKNIRLYNVKYKPFAKSCTKHRFCYGSKPMESTVSPFVPINDDIHDIELLPVVFDPFKPKGLQPVEIPMEESTRAKSVIPVRRNKNPLLPS